MGVVRGKGRPSEWVRTLGGNYSDTAIAAKVDSVGNVYIGGYYQNSNTDLGSVKDFANAKLLGRATGAASMDAFVAKFDANGNQLWIKTLASTGGSDQVNAIEVDASGNVYVVEVYNTGTPTDFAGNALTASSSADGFVAALDSSGTQLWVKTINGALSENVKSIAIDGSSVFVTGTFSNNTVNEKNVRDFAGNTLLGKTTVTGSVGTDIYVAKLSQLDGAQSWIRVLGGKGLIDSGNAIVFSNGAIYVGGMFLNSSTNVNAVTDFAGNTLNGLKASAAQVAYVAKLADDGSQSWIKIVGGTSSSGVNAMDYVAGVACDSANGVFVAGRYANSSTNIEEVFDFAGSTLKGRGGGSTSDAFVAKLP